MIPGPEAYFRSMFVLPNRNYRVCAGDFQGEQQRTNRMATSFWSFRRGTASSNIAGTAALQPIEEFEPVEIYTRAAMVTGTVVSHGERLSDILNRQHELRVHAPRASPMA